MEKFALLDFLKAFQTIAATGSKKPDDNPSVNEARGQPAQQPAPPPPQTSDLENNVMANVLARHEEIANRVKNKRSV